MKVKWYIDDGYCGKDRPQQTIISDDELAECETEEEKERLIAEYIQRDFEEKISWYRI